MSLYKDYLKYTVRDWFEKNAEPHEIKHAAAAFEGDAQAAFKLSIALENRKRGIIAVAMWRCKVPVEAFRVFLSSVWYHDHRSVIESAGNRRTLGHMFHYAAFPLPSELPDVMQVWRGTSFVSLKQAKAGYSWTTDRDTACWFAMRYANPNGFPLVLTGEIAKCDVSLFLNELSESEIVTLRAPTSRIDGDVNDWTGCFERKDAINKEANNNLM